jgi:predicted Zn finger-like uncharacterized protein
MCVEYPASSGMRQPRFHGVDPSGINAFCGVTIVAINFPCPHCGQTYKLNDNQVGTKGRCAKCQKVFVVSVPTPPPLAATASLPKPAAAPTPSPRRTDPAPRPDPLTSPIPRQLGRFEVRSKLGQGTFGAVYRAFDAILKREVAIKLPHAAALALDGVGERFLREAEAAAQLHHPNIVPVHDAGVCDGQLYIASAFIDGQTLQSAMRDQPLDHRRAARLIMKLADALAYAHDKGIVHRDVKPGNVMLDSQDEPYVMDFGLARWEQAGSQLTQDGSLLGTPAYMSPEQAGAPVGKVGPASDQYALGVMLYEMLTGRVPFSDSQLPVVLSKIRDEEAVSPRSLDGSIPLDLETICLKAMSKRPQDRYADGRALAADLRRWLDGEPIQARRLGVIERTVRWARKNKAVAGSLAAVAASLVLVAVVSSISAARMAVLRDQEAEQRKIAVEKQREAESSKAKETIERERANAALIEAAEGGKRVEAALAKEAEARATAVKNAKDAEESADSARRQLYVAHMNLIQSAWNESNIGRLSALLDLHKTDVYNSDNSSHFEWHYWNRLISRQYRTLERDTAFFHMSHASHLSFSAQRGHYLRLERFEETSKFGMHKRSTKSQPLKKDVVRLRVSHLAPMAPLLRRRVTAIRRPYGTCKSVLPIMYSEAPSTTLTLQLQRFIHLESISYLAPLTESFALLTWIQAWLKAGSQLNVDTYTMLRSQMMASQLQWRR